MGRIKNGVVQVDGRSMDYIAFGKGEETLLMIPGLSDGLQTVKGLALPFAWLYRKLARHMRVYCISRANDMAPDFSNRDMARDVKLAMEALGVEKASVLGVSQGGMIAQWLAIDFPEAVDKLILAVTTPRHNEVLRNCVSSWIDLALAQDYKGLVIQTSEMAYSEKYLKRFRLTYPFLNLMPRPKSYARYLIMSHACLTHDAYALLDRIQAATLVIGGEQDKILGSQGSRELAERIADCRLVMYPQYGHGAFEEAKDFQSVVLSFLQEA